MKKLADVYLNAQADRRLRAGHVWVYSNEIDGSRSPLRNFEPGQAVNIWSYRQECLGSGYINPHSLISVRRTSKKPDQPLHMALLLQRLQSALALRERLFKQPYYRWVYGEADGLPGIVIDRFGEVLAMQVTTAGMERLRAVLLEAVEQVLPNCCIVLRNNSSIRQLENLP
ncbi:MAG: RlmI/RlmK family 23S rRNA methyltransferase, partial [Burkholderiales bacterium]